MKKYCYLLLMLLLPAFIMTGCDGGSDGEEPVNGQITIPNQGDKSQTAYADDQQKGVTFTAKSAWTAGVTQTRSSSVTWLRLLLNGTETYSGGAGTFTLTIEIDPNTTGVERAAAITIESGGDQVQVSVTQKGVKQDNQPLTNKDLLIAHAWKHVSTTEKYLDIDWEDDVDTSVYTLTFKADGTATVDTESVTYTVSGNTVTFHSMYEGTPVEMVYAITKLTVGELSLSGGPFTGEWEDDNSGGGGGGGTFTYMQTMNFVKP